MSTSVYDMSDLHLVKEIRRIQAEIEHLIKNRIPYHTDFLKYHLDEAIARGIPVKT